MWGWRGASTERPEWVRWAIIAVIVALIIGIIIGAGRGGFSFGGMWWLIFIFPAIFGGSRRRSRRWRGEFRDDYDDADDAAWEKRKRGEAAYEAEAEKPKHVEYRLGDDGELIESDADADTARGVAVDEDEETIPLNPPLRRTQSGEHDRTQYV